MLNLRANLASMNLTILESDASAETTTESTIENQLLTELLYIVVANIVLSLYMSAAPPEFANFKANLSASRYFLRCANILCSAIVIYNKVWSDK